jgi:hypothetical protein
MLIIHAPFVNVPDTLEHRPVYEYYSYQNFLSLQQNIKIKIICTIIILVAALLVVVIVIVVVSSSISNFVFHHCLLNKLLYVFLLNVMLKWRTVIMFLFAL